MTGRGLTRTYAGYVAVLLAAALLLAGCGGGSDNTAAPRTTASASPSASGSASPSPSQSPSPVVTSPTPVPTPKTVAQLRRALLALPDVPPGFQVESGAGSGDDDVTISSPVPACAPLVKLLNEDKDPTSVAQADVSFSGGQEGPFIDETLDAFRSPAAATVALSRFRSAVLRCRSVTLAVPGVGRSKVQVAQVSFPRVGSATFAARFSATAGELAGFELLQVGAVSGDVLVGMTFIATDPAEAQEATEAAVGKVQKTLKSTPA